MQNGIVPRSSPQAKTERRSSIPPCRYAVDAMNGPAASRFNPYAEHVAHGGSAHDFSVPTFDTRYFKCSKAGCTEFWRIPTPPAPAQEHSESSKQAARQIDRNRYRQTVYEAHRRSGAAVANPVPFGVVGGCTDEEGIEATGIAASTYRPRRVELVRDGLLMDSGLTRKTKSNHAATVWMVTL